MITYLIYGQRDAEKWTSAIYRALGDAERADRYEARRRA